MLPPGSSQDWRYPSKTMRTRPARHKPPGLPAARRPAAALPRHPARRRPSAATTSSPSRTSGTRRARPASAISGNAGLRPLPLRDWRCAWPPGPAVSHQIATLERETRTALLRREARGVRLTAAGGSRSLTPGGRSRRPPPLSGRRGRWEKPGAGCCGSAARRALPSPCSPRCSAIGADVTRK
ncbi:LysR family transcriptional regulator [Streptomyces sp. I5]|uniref:LysR family transcriptional regulator n=1 Tax=Streptomyces sp. I5 TaxID=2759947 RepID=UPI0027DCE899|nr:LysR family transcriptional regulator [Streptomyces sp. I5]